MRRIKFLAGLIALTQIPVAQFPDIVPPQVSVTASYPGAGAAVVSRVRAQLRFFIGSPGRQDDVSRLMALFPGSPSGLTPVPDQDRPVVGDIAAGAAHQPLPVGDRDPVA